MSTPPDQPDRTALVTGGTGGLGSAVVRALLDDGWRVVVPWIAERELERAPRDEHCVLVQADLFEVQAVDSCVNTAADIADAPLRAVVNLVGGYAEAGRVHETSIEDFERMLMLNLRPTYLVTHAALPYVLDAGGGAVVCVSARAALQPFAGASGYITAKGAVLAFVRALAAEYRDDGVRANAILPSVIDTPANRAAMPDADTDRWVRPQEIARVVRFLLSDDAAPTSGAAIPVYGRA